MINATRDAPQFSVKEAAKSVAYASERFRLLGRADAIRQVAIESGHDYNRPMREAMYGWLDRWLRGRGDGGPTAEPEVKTEDPQTLRCYPDGGSRPKTIATIPCIRLPGRPGAAGQTAPRRRPSRALGGRLRPDAVDAPRRDPGRVSSTRGS